MASIPIPGMHMEIAGIPIPENQDKGDPRDHEAQKSCWAGNPTAEPLRRFPDATNEPEPFQRASPARCLLHPWYMYDILCFKFTEIKEEEGHVRVHENLKSQLETQLANVGISAALLLTIEGAFLFEIGGIEAEHPELSLALAVLITTSMVVLMTSVGHSIYYLAMISEFGSMDELVCWLRLIGSFQNFPAMMLMAGMWLTAGTIIVYVFTVFDHWRAMLVTGSGIGAFLFGHVVLTMVLRQYYNAIYKVSKEGWRLGGSKIQQKQD